jgi:hypothetical protein
MMQISDTTRSLRGISLLTVPAIEYGGVRLLRALVKREGRMNATRTRN